MVTSDQDKTKLAREYFMRADEARQDILELFHEDAEIYFPKFGFGFGRQSFFEMAKGFEGSLESIQHDYESFTFIPSGDYLIVEGTSHGRMSGKSWAGGKNSWRTILQRLQISRWSNIINSYLPRSRLLGRG